MENTAKEVANAQQLIYNLLSYPPDFEIGKTVEKENSFFDSFRQGLNRQLNIKVTVEELRQCCKEYAEKNPPEWFINATDNIHEYKNEILGERCADSNLEGRILCGNYDVKLYVSKKICNTTGQEELVKQIIDGEKGSQSVKCINFYEEKCIHIVNVGDRHFVALLRSDATRPDLIHGQYYQLKLLMLVLLRAVFHKYIFHLGTEIEQAHKFDDVYFKYTKGGKQEYQLIQAKHKKNEFKNKITAEQLLSDTGDFSLKEYFIAYRDINKEEFFKGDSNKNLILCTNVDFDYRSLNSKQIIVENIECKDDILDVISDKNPPKRCQLKGDVFRLLKPILQTHFKIAKRLTECILNNTVISHDKTDIFKSFQLGLAKEVINVKTKKFHQNFVMGVNLSRDANLLRDVFKVEIELKSKDKINLENINNIVSLRLSKQFGINQKDVGPTNVEEYEENWITKSYTDEEINDFLDHFVFAVNQPNEEELGYIIKSEIGKQYKLNYYDADSVYNKYQALMSNWFQGKTKVKFLSHENGKQILEEAKKWKPVRFATKDSVELFTGRMEELEELHEKIQRSFDRPTVISQITSICGLGGIGKTQLARKYVMNHSGDYDNIIWINSENDAALFESFTQLAKDKLGIHLSDEKDLKSIVDEVYAFFDKRKSLFIFDNAENSEYLKKYLPLRSVASSKPYVLITSRNREWQKGIEVLKLNVLNLRDAVNFVKKGLDIKDESQDHDIKNLLKKLFCFPLAIQQSIAYIIDKNITQKYRISNYLNEFGQKTKYLLNSEIFQELDNDYAKTTYTTWKITLDRIANQEHGQLATKIINIMAYLASEKINRDIFSKLSPDEEELRQAVRLLVKYSMVNSEEEHQSVLSIHRLVQEVTRINIRDKQREEEVLEEALHLFNADDESLNNIINYFTFAEIKNIMLEHNLDHAISVWGYTIKFERNTSLLRKFSVVPVLIVYLLKKSLRYQEANCFGSKALNLLEAVLAPNHSYIKHITMQIAVVLSMIGKCSEAFEILKKLESEENRKSVLLFNIQNLQGFILQKQGKHKKAEHIFQKREKEYGSSLCRKIFDSLILEENFVESLIRRKAFEMDNIGFVYDKPNTLETRNTTANELQITAKMEKALDLNRKDYEKRKRILGEKHEDTLTCYYNIAVCLDFLNRDIAEALRIANEVDKERVKLIPDHPSVVKGKFLIIKLLIRLDKKEEALEKLKQLHKKVVAIKGEYEARKEYNRQFVDSALVGDLGYLNFWLQQGADVNHLRGDNEIAADEDSCSPLHFAAHFGHVEIVKALLNKNANIEATNNKKITALHAAASHKHLDVVRVLLEAGANTDAVDEYGCSPLYFAAQNGHVEIVKLLVNKNANIEATNNKKITALHVAAFQKHLDVVKVLLEAGAFIDAVDVVGFRPLYLAAHCGHVEIVKALLNKNANLKATCNFEKTPLHAAASQKHLNVVRVLLEAGAFIDAADEDGCSPLHLAAYNGHGEIVEALLKKKADTEASNVAKQTPLHAAVSQKHLNVVRVLLEAGANFDTVDGVGFRPLYLAAHCGHVEIVKALLNKNANIEATSICEQTPLHTAASIKHLDVATVLLEAGAYIDAEDKDGCSPLYFAAQNGHVEMVKALLDRNANIGAANVFKQTPLHAAVCRKHLNVVRVLLEAGANIDAVEVNGSSPLHLAAKNGHMEIVKELLNKNANIDATNIFKQTPLHTAAYHKQLDVVRFLLEAGANIDPVTELYFAAQNGHVEIVKGLVNKNANIDATNVCKQTPLHVAASENHLDVVRVLLQAGASVEAVDVGGCKPLYFAAHYGHVEIVKVLLNTNANIDATNNKKITPLHVAASHKHLDVVRVLLAAGANTDAADEDGCSPLHVAAETGHTEIVKALLNKNANIEATCFFEQTPLHVAACYKHLDVVRVLLEAGANIDAVDKYNCTPSHLTNDLITNVLRSTKQLLMGVRENRHLGDIQRLINAGAVLNYFSDKNRLTPLHYAVSKGNTNAVRILLENNSNVNVVDSEGWTAIHYASQEGWSEIVQLLLANGADSGIENYKGQTPLDLARKNFPNNPQIYQKIINVLSEMTSKVKNVDMPT